MADYITTFTNIDEPLEKIIIISRLYESGYHFLADTARRIFRIDESAAECKELAASLTKLFDDCRAAGSSSSDSRSGILDIHSGPDGEPYVIFPDELIQQLGWTEGDQLVWIDNNDGSFTLKKRAG